MKAVIPRVLILRAMEYVAERNIGQGISFDIRGTDNIGFLKLERGFAPDRQVCLKTAVVRNGDDHLVQHFYHDTADLEGMRAWLRDPDNAEGIMESLQQLSGRVDQGFD